VLSQGHEVVGPSYSMLLSAAATDTAKGRRSDNLNRVIRVGDRDGRPGNPNQVIWVNSREQQWPDYLGRVSASRVAYTEQHLVNTENRVT
jgi:hypothetical protein